MAPRKDGDVVISVRGLNLTQDVLIIRSSMENISLGPILWLRILPSLEH